jgi:hypothetical protein
MPPGSPTSGYASPRERERERETRGEKAGEGISRGREMTSASMDFLSIF